MDPQPFVPILTVMVDYGNAPLLSRIDAPQEGGLAGLFAMALDGMIGA